MTSHLQYLEGPLPADLWRREGDGFVLEAQNDAARDHGYLQPSDLGRRASELYEDAPEVLEQMQRVWESGERTTLRVHAQPRRVLLLDIVRWLPQHVVVYAREPPPAVPDVSEGYRIVLEDAVDGIAIVDPATGRIMDANVSARGMLGYRWDEFIEASIDEHVHPEDQASDPIRLHSVHEVRPPRRECRLLRKGGEIFFAEIHTHVLPDGRVVAVIRDLTERREREAAVQRSQDHYRRMIERSPDANLVHVDGIFVYANPAAVRLIGATDASEIVGKPALSFVTPDIVSSVQAEIRLLLEQQNELPPLVEKFHRKDGTVIDIEVTAFRIEWQEQPAVQVIIRDVTSRIRSEVALRASEERYRGLVENAAEAIFRLGRDGRILSVNPACMRITGWSEQELLGMRLQELLHPDDLRRGEETVAATLEGGRGTAVFRLFRSDGSVAYIDTTTTPEFTEGSITAVFGVGRDVSAARAAAERLAESERMLSAVLDQLPVGVTVADTSGRIIRWNRVSEKIWGGHRLHTAVASTAYRGWWPETGQPLRQEDWASVRALRHGEISNRELVDIEAFDGTRKTILNSATPLRDAGGNIEGVVIVNEDVTEQRAITRLKDALSVRLGQMIASTSEGIITVDPGGRINLLNPAAAAMLGYDEAEVIDKDFHSLVHGPDVAEDKHSILEVMRCREAQPLFSDSFRDRSGTLFEVEVSCAPMIVEDEVIGAVVAFRDVTRRNATERELESNRRLSSLGQLAATIAHEFNNVMMGIMPFLDVVIRRLGRDDALRPMAEHVKNALRRGKQITSEVLKFTQGSKAELRPVRMAGLLQSAADELRAIAGSQVELRIAPVRDDVAAAVDPTLFLQVLSNLVANARDAMAGAGVITIESAVSGIEDRRRLARADPGEYVRVSIADEGCGMDEKTMQRMFEPLFTTKHAGGTGLGLAVVQQIMTKHEGIVIAESTVGAGTTFHLYFRRSALPPAEVPRDARGPLHQIERVLIIEDDESVAAGLTAILEVEDIAVRLVTSGSEAIPAIEAFRPDAVLLDRGLPDADGIAVCRTILRRWPDLPIVFSTGHGSRRDLEEMLGRPQRRLSPQAV